ncbi:MAG: nucleotidyltransferase domain-containing protein [Candidatus Delongbacteria bacterium]|jgi:predicted nucleotidyltransferase|nr:nucleotidyltransferase domain-containing protein [Candidatus Delongbacteria bacterium]MDY0018236.1 nucleotidyltransferase domain-containing protein [Candidatus Delongbacteria bacterium]
MSKETVLKILKKFKSKYQSRFGFLKLGLFGSYVKEKQTEESDIDIVVQIPDQDFFELIEIKQELEKEFSRKVDLISYRDKMNAFLKKRIEQEAIFV